MSDSVSSNVGNAVLGRKPEAAQSSVPRTWRVSRIGSWVARVLLAVQFLAGGVLKIVGDPTMVSMFDQIGVGQGLRLLIGACEIAGGISVLVAPLRRLAAAGLAALMVGATVINIAVLHTSPAVPIVLGVLALIVAATPTRTMDGE